MKDVKNMKMKEERIDGNQIKRKGIMLKLMRKKRYMFNLFGFRPDFFIIPLLLLNIVTIERHLLSIMKDVKNMKMKEERKGGNQIKLKSIILKLMRKKGICLICLILDDFFIISLLLLNIVMIEWHLLSIMKDVKNTKTKEERKDDNQI